MYLTNRDEGGGWRSRCDAWKPSRWPNAQQGCANRISRRCEKYSPPAGKKKPQRLSWGTSDYNCRKSLAHPVRERQADDARYRVRWKSRMNIERETPLHRGGFSGSEPWGNNRPQTRCGISGTADASIRNLTFFNPMKSVLRVCRLRRS